MESTVGTVEREVEEHLGETEVTVKSSISYVSVKCKIPAGGDTKGTTVIKPCELYFAQLVSGTTHQPDIRIKDL